VPGSGGDKKLEQPDAAVDTVGIRSVGSVPEHQVTGGRRRLLERLPGGDLGLDQIVHAQTRLALASGVVPVQLVTAAPFLLTERELQHHLVPGGRTLHQEQQRRDLVDAQLRGIHP
jgi:hypothetical protein